MKLGVEDPEELKSAGTKILNAQGVKEIFFTKSSWSDRESNPSPPEWTTVILCMIYILVLFSFIGKFESLMRNYNFFVSG